MKKLLLSLVHLGCKESYNFKINARIRFANIYALWIVALGFIPFFFWDKLSPITFHFMWAMPFSHIFYWLLNAWGFHKWVNWLLILQTTFSIFLASLLLGTASHVHLFFFVGVILPIFLLEKFPEKIIAWLFMAFALMFLEWKDYQVFEIQKPNQELIEQLRHLNNALILIFGIAISYYINYVFQDSEQKITFLLERSNKQNQVLLKHHHKINKQNTELASLNKQLADYKDTLEERIRERTQAIENTQNQLQKALDFQEQQNQILLQKEQELQKIYQTVLAQNQELQELNDSLLLTQKNLEKSLATEREQKQQIEQIYQDFQKAQLQLFQSEKMAALGMLTSGIIHEINNPLNFVSVGISNIAEIIQDIKKICQVYQVLENQNLEKNSEMLMQIIELKQLQEYEQLWNHLNLMLKETQEGTRRMNEIVKSIRFFAHQNDEILQATNLHEVIGFALVILKNEYKNRVRIEQQYGQIPPIFASAGQLCQVFINLINNALQAIEHQDGLICIRTQQLDENHIEISISDNGKGISPQVQGRIFEAFFTTKAAGKGTGLGLSISKNIIEKYKGSIHFHSQEGCGTTFYIRLPINSCSHLG